jgi:hypothetical protein
MRSPLGLEMHLKELAAMGTIQRIRRVLLRSESVSPKASVSSTWLAFVKTPAAAPRVQEYESTENWV